MKIRNKKQQHSSGRLRRNDEKANKYSCAKCGDDIEFSKRFHESDTSDIRSFNISFSSNLKKHVEFYTKIFEHDLNLFSAISVERAIEIGIEQIYQLLKSGYTVDDLLKKSE